MVTLINILILNTVLDSIQDHIFFLILDFDFGKNVIRFSVGNSSSPATDN